MNKVDHHTMTADPHYKGAADAEDYNDLVSMRRHGVLPPTRVYVTVDDVLFLEVLNPSTVVSVAVSIRLLTPDGQVIPQFYNFANVPAAGGVTSFIMRSAEGFILSATVSIPGSSMGAAWVQLSVRRGIGTADVTEGDLLLAGYPGSIAQIGYPVSPPAAPSSGAGLARTITPANPAAGADWTVTVPAGAVWNLTGVRAQLATSATAANRIPDLQGLDAASNVIMDALAGVAQTAGLTGNWVWAPGAITSTVLGATISVNLPAGVRLPPGGKLRTVTAGIQAADQWSSIVISVQEFIAA